MHVQSHYATRCRYTLCPPCMCAVGSSGVADPGHAQQVGYAGKLSCCARHLFVLYQRGEMLDQRVEYMVALERTKGAAV